jgi:hypothetical protein
MSDKDDDNNRAQLQRDAAAAEITEDRLLARKHRDPELENQTHMISAVLAFWKNPIQHPIRLKDIRAALDEANSNGDSGAELLELRTPDGHNTFYANRAELEGIVHDMDRAEAKVWRDTHDAPEEKKRRQDLSEARTKDEGKIYELDGLEDKRFFADQVKVHATIDELRYAAKEPPGWGRSTVEVRDAESGETRRVDYNKLKAFLKDANEEQDELADARDEAFDPHKSKTAVASASAPGAKRGATMGTGTAVVVADTVKPEFAVASGDTRHAKGHGQAHKGGHRRTRHAPDDDAPAFIAADEGEVPAVLKTGFHSAAAGKTEPMGGGDFKTFLSGFITMLDKAEAVARTPSRAKPEGQLVSNDSPTPTPPT